MEALKVVMVIGVLYITSTLFMISIGIIPLLSINSRSRRLFWPNSFHAKDTLVVVSIATSQRTKRSKIPQFNNFSAF